jgi:hypothetical protein
VIERLTAVRHHPAHIWALLHYRLGWIVQRPKRWAAERDQAAIDRWVKKASAGVRVRRLAGRLGAMPPTYAAASDGLTT